MEWQVDPEDVSQDPSPEAVEPEGHSDPGVESQEFSGHPAWKPFEEALGPIHYRTIEPHLRSMSQAAEAKIAASNKALEPWKAFIDQKIDPQALQLGQKVMEEINTNPRGFYDRLADYLRQNGQLEEARAVEAQADAVDDQNDTAFGDDPRIAQLEAQLEQLRNGQQEFLAAREAELQQREFSESVQREEQKLETEVQDLKKQGFDDFAIGQILNAAQLHNFRTGQILPLAEAAKQFTQLRQSILTQPRPQAPRLPAGSGGVPSNAPVDLSTASRQQSVDTLAALISQANG